MEHYGVVDASSTLYVFFTTHAQTGAAVAPSSAFEAADVRIYKNGSATQRASEAGYTMTSPFDSITGLHLLAVDLSDNTDAGFYAAGSRYTIVLSPDETVDSLAVVRVLADFHIGPAAADVEQWLGTAAATPTVAGVPEVDLTHVAGSTTSVSTLASSVATLLADIGGVATAAADGDPTSTDLLFAYIKQLINILIGTTGIVTFPASAAPANNVSLAEVIRQMYDEVAGLNGGALLDAAGVRSAVGLASANLDTQLSTIDDFLDTEIAAIKAKTDNLPSDPADQSLLEAILGTPAGASLAADLAAIEAQTDDIGVAGAGLTAVPWNASWDAEVQSEVQDALDATLADSVPSDGTRPSAGQALYAIYCYLLERSVSGTTLTVKKVDGTTTLMTITLNDATNPTAHTRSG